MVNVFPRKLTTFLITITFLLLGSLIFEIWNYQRSVDDIQRRYIPTLELSGIIIRINEILSHHIEMAVETRDSKWKDMYESYKYAMIDSIEQLFGNIPGNYKLITTKDEIRRKDIEEAEKRIFESIDKKTKEAKIRMIKKEYMKKSWIYKQKISLLAEKLNEHLENELNRKRRRTEILAYIFSGIFVIWMVLWIILIRIYKINFRIREIAESDLQKSKERFRDVAMASGDWIWEVDSEGRYTYVAGDIQNILGYDADELLGKTPFELMPEEEAKKIAEEFLQIVGRRDQIKDLENWNIKKDGSEVLLLTNGSPIFDDDGEYCGYVGVDKDITYQREEQKEKEKMQRQIFQSSKMASIGVLASGVAHELNNPLTAVLGFAQIIRKKISDTQKIEEFSKRIETAAIRMKKIIDHLRQFSRKTEDKDWTQVNINDPINNSLIILESQLKYRDINVILDLDEDIHPIWGDANQLESIFQNFLSNSKDAFDSVDDGRKKTIRISTMKNEEGITVLYSDNAGGIKQEIINNIFDPFFTTKETGKGTGLGLSIVHNIIEDHKGKIVIQSLHTKGTQFEISFPRDRRKQERLDEESIIKTIVKDNIDESKLSILVLDDEEVICEILQDFLEEDYNVVTFCDPKMALEDIQRNRYDMIISDLKMPDFSGMDILFAVKKVWPDTKVVMMSGHGKDDPELVNAMKQGVSDVITKPFVDENVVKSVIKKIFEES